MLTLQIENKLIPYGSILFFELHQHNKTKSNLNWDEFNSIKIFYLNDTTYKLPEDFKPHELKIKSCLNDEFCTIKKFKESLESYIITESDWEKDCKGELIEEKEDNSKKSTSN